MLICKIQRAKYFSIFLLKELADFFLKLTKKKGGGIGLRILCVKTHLHKLWMIMLRWQNWMCRPAKIALFSFPLFHIQGQKCMKSKKKVLNTTHTHTLILTPYGAWSLKTPEFARNTMVSGMHILIILQGAKCSILSNTERWTHFSTLTWWALLSFFVLGSGMSVLGIQWEQGNEPRICFNKPFPSYII